MTQVTGWRVQARQVCLFLEQPIAYKAGIAAERARAEKYELPETGEVKYGYALRDPREIAEHRRWVAAIFNGALRGGVSRWSGKAGRKVFATKEEATETRACYPRLRLVKVRLPS